MSKAGGIVLVGVGLTSACLQIANTAETKEKNKIFVETITNTAVGAGLGFAIGLYLVSTIGWGTAIVLAVSSTGGSWGLGKFAGFLYDKYGKIDFVTGTGTDRVCK